MSEYETLDKKVQDALIILKNNKSAAELIDKAVGVLIFPDIVKAGLLGFGGSIGGGALIVGDKTQGHYSQLSASFGFQLGVESYSYALIFLTKNALDKFVNSSGFEIGVTASVAVINLGVGTEVNTHNIQNEIVAIVYDTAGLMYSLSLEGTKITKLDA